jgi:DNA invertase Pin-like site-specific DNA recombinase
MKSPKLSTTHFERRAFVYVRQSSAMQVHENVESKQRQYALVERALALGWNRADIEVIDEDQAKSGASTNERTGFIRLADAVARGEAGAILALEVSRLARSSADWQRLLSLCAVAGVAVMDEQAVYDPADHNDRLLLDIKGTMSEAELHWLRLRLVGGRVNKARRGELWLQPATGYVWGDRGFALDPDEAVRRAVTLVFERFAVEPSGWAVVKWARETGFRFPCRGRDGEIEWRPLTEGRLSDLLRNPVYAGIYAYGRKPKRKQIIDGEIHVRQTAVSSEQWQVRIEGAHPAYISVETYRNNMARLTANRSSSLTTGAAKDGPALLAGIVLCGRCGRRMRVDYTTRERTSWRYVCEGERLATSAICWSVNADVIDRAVEELFLQATVPAEIDLSLAVEQEANTQAASLAAQWQSRLEQVRYEARRAERRFKAVDPDNRVVARTLEAEWEARLRDLEEVERQYGAARRERRVEFTAADREKLRAIARDLPQVWRSPLTKPSERKAMLRLVIEAISVAPVDIPKRMTRVRVQWSSGAVDELLVERIGRGTPTALLERIQAMTVDGLRDVEIAEQFNREGLVTAKHKPFTAHAILHLRGSHGIQKSKPRTGEHALPDRHPVRGWYSVPGAARRFGVPTHAIKNWIRDGHVVAHRERYDRYNAIWLDIDASTEAKLDRLSRSRTNN